MAGRLMEVVLVPAGEIKPGGDVLITGQLGAVRKSVVNIERGDAGSICLVFTDRDVYWMPSAEYLVAVVSPDESDRELATPRPPQSLTTDPSDPRLGHGSDAEPVDQHEVYLVLSEEERAKGFVRPYRDAYRHVKCEVNPGCVTRMGTALSETYARDPSFYGATYCVACRMHKPVSEFVWDKDGQVVGS